MSLREIQKNVKQHYTHALSVNDIQNFFKKLFKKNVRIIDVHQIELDYTLNDLFENDIDDFKCSINNQPGEYIKDVLVLFVPTQSAYFGHYQLIMKKNHKIYFFDSYGEEYNELPKKVNKNGIVFISDNFGKLVLNSGYDIFINKNKYQTNNIEDSTCGFHVSICAFYFILQNDPNFTSYNDFVKSYLNETTHTKYDSIVLYLFKNLQPKNNL